MFEFMHISCNSDYFYKILIISVVSVQNIDYISYKCAIICGNNRIFVFPSAKIKLYFQQATYVNGKCSVCWQLHLKSKMGILQKLIQIYCWNSERNWTVVYKSIHEKHIFSIFQSLFLPNVSREYLY